MEFRYFQPAEPRSGFANARTSPIIGKAATRYCNIMHDASTRPVSFRFTRLNARIKRDNAPVVTEVIAGGYDATVIWRNFGENGVFNTQEYNFYFREIKDYCESKKKWILLIN